MNGPRYFAAALAISGIVFAAVSWAIPPFWPGYVVWAGWICIAVNFKKTPARWFWWLSAIWNLILLAMLLSDTDWTLENKALVYWHARLHSAVAVVLSGASLNAFRGFNV